MIPILAIVVDIPAIKGNAPQTPHPIEPKKNNFQNSLLKLCLFLTISLKKKGSKIKKNSNPSPKSKRYWRHVLNSSSCYNYVGSHKDWLNKK